MAAEKAKFLVLREYIQANYDFENSDKDDSKQILMGIMATIKNVDDPTTHAEDDNFSEGEAEPILVESDE